MQLFACITGHGPTAYIAGFNAKKLEKKQTWAKENGYSLIVLNHVPAPAAEGISKPLSKQDADRAMLPAKQDKPKRFKVETKQKKVPVAVNIAPKPRKRAVRGTSVKKAKSIYAHGKHPNSQQKASVPVINITMGTYHISAAAAAKAIGGSDSSICYAMKYVGKKGNPPKHKKCLFRHATPEEIAAKKVLVHSPKAC